ncbi:MAG TPA: winged helix-turn-helix domain-containing protein [Vicinamibacterales bacterium]|nr:winged helix-turn-helix domain-containing protein [Vicinamibacterales bacterium]
MPGRMRFGMFEFDSDALTLSREGLTLRLQPQPARVLALLLERPGEVVPRETLRQRVWSDGTVVDFERGLNFCIAQIRSTLGDSADSPRFIETLPRRGYRFIAPVRRLDAEPAAPDHIAASATVEDSHRLRTGAWGGRRAVVLATAGVLAVAVLTGVAGWRIALDPAPVRVAVVPFDNETGEDALDAVAAGVADATVARLSTPDRLRHVSVIGNSAALRRPRAFRDLKEIGQAVEADYVVLAQMKRDDERVRLIAHFIRVSDEAHVWAQTYDRPAFTLDVQAEIAEAIAQAVSARVR